MAKKPKGNSKSLTSTKPKRKPSVRWDPAFIQTIENIVFDTGMVEGAISALGVSRTTLFRWLREKSDLKHSVTRARESYVKFRDRAIQGELMSAVEGLNMLLRGHTVTLEDESTEVIRNEETGEVLKTVNVKKRRRQQFIKPDIRAIEKVLGTGDLRTAINLKAFEDRMLNGKADLYLLVFGKLVSNMDTGSIAEFVGVSVLNIQLDLALVLARLGSSMMLIQIV